MLAANGLTPPEDGEHFARVVETIRTRFSTLLDFATKGRAYFSDEFPIDPAAKEKLDVPDARALLHELGERIAANPAFTEASVEADLRALAAEKGVKAGVLINGSRAALTGQPVGPSAFAVFACLGRDHVIDRLRKV